MEIRLARYGRHVAVVTLDTPCRAIAPDRKSFHRAVLSCDPAGKAGVHNDDTAIIIVGVQRHALYALEASRGHWTVMQMRERIIELAARWQADLVIIEDTGSGMPRSATASAAE
jgi:hypothetical protein